MSEVNIRPLHDRLLVRRMKEEEKTAGGIIIPDTAKEKPQKGLSDASRKWPLLIFHRECSWVKSSYVTGARKRCSIVFYFTPS